MMNGRRAIRSLVPAIACTLLAAGLALAAGGKTSVSYVAGSSIYVNAGTKDGLAKGDTLQVFHGGVLVARLRVAFVASQRAACDTLWTRGFVDMGDEVRFRANPVLLATHVDSVRTATVRADSVARSARLATAVKPRTLSANRHRVRGRVGGRWLSVETSDGSSFKQPALDVRFDDLNNGGNHLDIAFDMRTRRTTRNFTGGSAQTEETARLYRAAITVRSTDANRRFTMGRQSSPTLASINLFDGALLELGNGRHSVGMFSGTQPDPVHYDFSGDILQSGGYVEWHQAPLALTRWSFALGGVTSQEKGIPNRDFFFSQAYLFSKRVSLSLTQEVDFNRGWKRLLGEPALSATSTFGSLRVPITDWFSVNTGYDNRRNVRLYRDRLTPETQFDDAYREGAWVGSELSLLGKLRLSGETRSASGSDRSHSWSGSAEAYRFAPLHASARVRASRFYGTTVETRLLSTGLGFDPLPMSHIETSGGIRKTHDGFANTDDTERWQSVDLDLTLGRNWYLNGGWERDYGGNVGSTRQLQGGLSWRF